MPTPAGPAGIMVALTEQLSWSVRNVRKGIFD